VTGGGSLSSGLGQLGSEEAHPLTCVKLLRWLCLES
jgi:hypothetical protein